MEIKKMLTLIEILAVTSVVSVGFSTWTFVQNADPFVENVNFGTEDVFHINSFFDVDKMEMFKFSSTGVFYDDSLDFQGDIKVSFYIQMKDGLYDFLTDKNNLSLNLTLANTGTFNLLDNELKFINQTINYGVYTDTYGDTYPNSALSTLESSQVTSVISYSNDFMDLIDKLYFTIVYHFDFSAYKINFEEEIYNQIDEDGIGFNFKIGVNF